MLLDSLFANSADTIDVYDRSEETLCRQFGSANVTSVVFFHISDILQIVSGSKCAVLDTDNRISTGILRSSPPDWFESSASDSFSELLLREVLCIGYGAGKTSSAIAHPSQSVVSSPKNHLSSENRRGRRRVGPLMTSIHKSAQLIGL